MHVRFVGFLIERMRDQKRLLLHAKVGKDEE